MPTKESVFGEVLRQRDVLQSAILLLLKEHESHGYELHSRLGQFRPNLFPLATGTIYRILRVMEEEHLLASSWETDDQREPRRKYGVTEEGDDFQQDAMPWVICQRDVLDAIANRYTNIPKAPLLAGRQAAVVAEGSQRDMLRRPSGSLELRGMEPEAGLEALNAATRVPADAQVEVEYISKGERGLLVTSSNEPSVIVGGATTSSCGSVGPPRTSVEVNESPEGRVRLDFLSMGGEGLAG